MNAGEREVTTVEELLASAAGASVGKIAVVSDLAGRPCSDSRPDRPDRGRPREHKLRRGEDGVQLSVDYRVEGFALRTDASRRALFNDVSVKRLGRFELRNLCISGLVQILARDRVRSATDLGLNPASISSVDG